MKAFKFNKQMLSLLISVWVLSPAHGLISHSITLHPSEMTEIEGAFFSDLDDGKLSDYTLFDAFLIASQIKQPSNFNKYQLRLNQLVEEVKEEFNYDADPYVKADSLLKWLHIHFFENYYLHSFAYNVMEGGEFNCLSSGILYALLAREVGLNVVGVLAKDHAYCRLLDPRGDKDIQTTVKYGFDPEGDKVARINKLTGFSYTPGVRQESVQLVEMLPFIGALYANRISLLELSTKDIKSDLAVYKKGFYFDPKGDFFKQNLLASYNQLCIRAIKQKKYFSLPGYLNEVDSLAGPKNNIRENTWKTIYAEAKRFYDQKQHEEAEIILGKGLEIFPEHPELKQQRVSVLRDRYVGRAQAKLSEKNVVEALAIAEEGLKKLPESKELQNLKAQIESARGLN